MKIYVRAMSMEKEKAKKQISSFSDIVMEHLIKLLMYSDIRPNDIDGWIKSVANWISRADNITIKPSAKKLKEEDIMSSLFSCMGDDVRDYERALYSFLADNHSGKYNHEGKESYPEFEVTPEASESLMNLCNDVIDVTMPLLIDKQDHSKDEYEAAIRNLLSDYL